MKDLARKRRLVDEYAFPAQVLSMLGFGECSAGCLPPRKFFLRMKYS